MRQSKHPAEMLPPISLPTIGENAHRIEGTCSALQSRSRDIRARDAISRTRSAADLEGAEAVVLAAGARPGPVSVNGAAERGVTLCTAHEVLDTEAISGK